MSRIRNLAFAIMLVATFGAMQADLLAYLGQPLEWFCQHWEDEPYNCEVCNLGGGFPPGWTANGECDFSFIEDEQDRLFTAAAYLDEAWTACEETCDSDDYREFVADWYEWASDPQHACYEVRKDPQCWETWGHVGGQAGPGTTWSCSCQRWNWCDCGS